MTLAFIERLAILLRGKHGHRARHARATRYFRDLDSAGPEVGSWIVTADFASVGRQDLKDEISLTVQVREPDGSDFRREAVLQCHVLPCYLRVPAEGIAEGQRIAGVARTGFSQRNVVPAEAVERAGEIVSVR